MSKINQVLLMTDLFASFERYRSYSAPIPSRLKHIKLEKKQSEWLAIDKMAKAKAKRERKKLKRKAGVELGKNTGR